jgi:hypothetical protein
MCFFDFIIDFDMVLVMPGVFIVFVLDFFMSCAKAVERAMTETASSASVLFIFGSLKDVCIAKRGQNH